MEVTLLNWSNSHNLMAERTKTSQNQAKVRPKLETHFLSLVKDEGMKPRFSKQIEHLASFLERPRPKSILQ